MRAPHVHFEVEAKYDRLITQMFFPAEALNEQDHFLACVTDRSRTPALGLTEAIKGLTLADAALDSLRLCCEILISG